MVKPQIKGWCPSLEKPMASGDGLLVRIPIKFGRVRAEVARKIAELSTQYGNGHLDLSARGNLQLRGVSEQTYPLLKDELAELGFVSDIKPAIMVSPLSKEAEEVAEKLYAALSTQHPAFINLPEKFLIVIDSGGVFPLSAIPCDLYVFLTPSPLAGEGWGGGWISSNNQNTPLPNPPPQGGRGHSCIVDNILSILQNTKKCAKKPADKKSSLPALGFIPYAEQNTHVCGAIFLAVPFGRLKAEELVKLAAISDEFASGEVIFAPFRRVILPNIAADAAENALQQLKTSEFIVKNNDSRLNIHACVGAPACSSALGDTRLLAEKWAKDFPNLTQIVHITGCSKGCAYKGKADITITATETGYNIAL